MSKQLSSLIHYLSKLPGVGNKTAKRFAIHLLKHKDNIMIPLSKTLNDTAHSIKKCIECGNYDENDICYICTDNKRDSNIICVVETIADLWALEESKIFNGLYHVLGGTLSASTKQDSDKLNINNLPKRLAQLGTKELIIATNTTIDGQTTAFYITEKLKPLNIKITRLASGIPIGGELNYLDEGTISAAFISRKDFA